MTPAEYDLLKERLHEMHKWLPLHLRAADQPFASRRQTSTTSSPSMAEVAKDHLVNFALTHSSCNRSKQASDLRVARVLARFAHIRQRCIETGHGSNLSDVLTEFGGAKQALRLAIEDGTVRYSLDGIGDNRVYETPLHTDKLSEQRYFFAKLPIEYLPP